MSKSNLACLMAAIALCCSTGCASIKPVAAPAVTLNAPVMGEAEMAALQARAEQASAAGKLADAGALYGQLVTAFPDHAVAWFRLGTVYLRQGQPVAAQHAWENALRADPGMTKVYANLALAHLAQFREAATRAIASKQVAESNRLALRGLLRDVELTLAK